MFLVGGSPTIPGVPPAHVPCLRWGRSWGGGWGGRHWVSLGAFTSSCSPPGSRGPKQMASNLCLALGSGRGRQTHNSAHSGAHKRGREPRASTSPRAGRQARCSTDGAPGNPGQGPGVSVPISSLQMLKPRLRGATWGARGRVASKWEGKGPHSAFSAGNTTHVTDKRDRGTLGKWGGQGRRVSGW